MHEQIDALFAPGGPLARQLSSYEERSEQLEVAHSVARALLRQESLLVEAGTGTGKSLAYLLPALLSGQRVVVSTATRHLQEQLWHKDLPLLRAVLGEPIHAQLQKGRANYLCRARLDEAQKRPHLPGFDGGERHRLMAWSEVTQTGDRAELDWLADDTPLWREVSVSSDLCDGRRCAYYESCFVTRMRERASSAQLCIVNHHLYTADLALRMRGVDPGAFVLAPHDAVVFDEAHELEEVGSQHFGCEVSQRRLDEILRELRRAQLDTVGNTAALSVALERELAGLFASLPFGDGRKRLREEDVASALGRAYEQVDRLLAELEAELGSLPQPEAASGARRLAALGADLALVLGTKARAPVEPDSALGQARLVRFTELHGRTRVVVARPVDVAPLFSQSLGATPTIYISATLTVGQSFEHTRRRLGVDNARELLVASPFDYGAQAVLYLPDDLPEPQEPTFGETAAALAARLVEASLGGALVLCTSYRALSTMRAAFLARGLDVLVQGEAPKTRLLDRFRGQEGAALIATLSFWQGVDVPGSALRLVIIDKLPFASPQDPLVRARIEATEQEGLEPFWSYQLPQAALMLRQGFGRLIRHRDDCGMVAIFDRRVLTKSYGKLLLGSLPACPQIRSAAQACNYLASLAACASP